MEPVPQFSLDTAWLQGARLQGYDLPSPAAVAGAPVYLTLYWQPASLDPDYDVVVELVDERGAVAGVLEEHCNGAQPQDAEQRALRGRSFTTPDDLDLAPGRYTLRVGLRSKAGAWVPLSDGATFARLATIALLDGGGSTPSGALSGR
jgi:hypothetical protein